MGWRTRPGGGLPLMMWSELYVLLMPAQLHEHNFSSWREISGQVPLGADKALTGVSTWYPGLFRMLAFVSTAETFAELHQHLRLFLSYFGLTRSLKTLTSQSSSAGKTSGKGTHLQSGITFYLLLWGGNPTHRSKCWGGTRTQTVLVG